LTLEEGLKVTGNPSCATPDEVGRLLSGGGHYEFI
jgi:hypothetical protein